MIRTENFKQVHVSSALELRAWLEKQHGQQESVWLVTFKKVVPGRYVSTSEVLDELLCFGWTDGIRRKLDDERTMQLISPRRVDHWTRSYKDRASKLIRSGRMHDAGLRSIAVSKESGSWEMMDEVDDLQIPNDLLEALGKYDGALEFFRSINDSSKRFVLRWIKLAKKEATRSSRIKKIAELSVNGEKLKGS